MKSPYIYIYIYYAQPEDGNREYNISKHTTVELNQHCSINWMFNK